MEINAYQKEVLLSLLKSRVNDEEDTNIRLSHTIEHNENWAIPITEKSNNFDVVKVMQNIVNNAKRDIDTNKKDLEQIKDLIKIIENLVVK
jgi:hypothetical protein